MKNENTQLIGQALQIRDKIFAKRHSIPNNLQGEWQKLAEKTACFDSTRLFNGAVKGSPAKKPCVFRGSASELSKLISKLKAFNVKLTQSQFHH
ncbi:hypothetical protein OCL06_11655 [Alteromonas sp. ASW11-19]|uniref:Uncharacterized protein n=1 Tax=Alteromonas salexigens TaxID=2982530 RepID=A0ABT2VQA1_9ALTE|nr:hypothetical protein [Alteromonas salexigens]MCU7555249.1 hypothetical protein [Alteromonas salexigens]